LVTAIRKAGPWLVVVAVVLLLRVLFGGWVECRRGDAELGADRPFQAALHYERAVRWYIPASPYVARAADALWDMGQTAEESGDVELALFAFRGLRSGAYATRSFYQPLPRRIADADEHIASLMILDPQAAWPDPGLSPEKRRAEVLENLQQHTDPSTAWVIILEIGLLTWLACAAALAWGLGREKRTARRTWILASASSLGYALWLVGMWLA
jgi:hypothetical protein